MRDLLKNYICEAFASEDMQNYLCKHVDRLPKIMINTLLGGAPVSIQRKLEWFTALAEHEDLAAEHAADEYSSSDWVEKTPIDFMPIPYKLRSTGCSFWRVTSISCEP